MFRIFFYLRKKRETRNRYYYYSTAIFSIYKPFVSKITREHRHRNHHLRFYIPRISNIRIFRFPLTEHGRKKENRVYYHVVRLNIECLKRKELEHLENVSSPGASETQSIQL